MPELPEVETVRLGLDRLIVGLTIKSVVCDNPKSFPNSIQSVSDFVLNSRIEEVSRRAKVLFVHLSSGYSLMVHLKMTGQLVYVAEYHRFGAGHPDDSLVNNLPSKSTRVTIEFTDGTKLYFNDQRKFGWMKLIKNDEIKHDNFIKKLGPEPLEDSFGPDEFANRLKSKKNSSIKSAILDQTVLAGVGNIYADESLWGAKIHPATLVGNLNKKQIVKLLQEIKYVLNLSLEKGGSTDKNYVQADGKKGSYLEFARVFRREGQICSRCHQTILKTRIASRGTHYCPKCQKL